MVYEYFVGRRSRMWKQSQREFGFYHHERRRWDFNSIQGHQVNIIYSTFEGTFEGNFFNNPI